MNEGQGLPLGRRDAALVLVASATAAVIHGGPGPDVLVGTDRADVIHAGAGGDVVYGRAGPDTLYGGPGADRLFGGPGDDTLFALANDNRRDYLDCGAGDDTANLNVHERGLYRVVGCEHVNWVDPSPEEAAEEAS